MNNAGAAKDISAVSGPCTQLAGGSRTGLVYPFDFPDPSVILAGQTYFAYATNSVAGSIQIIESTDLSHWTAVGNALPSLPAWATPDNTWAPSVAMIGGTFVLYYAATRSRNGGRVHLSGNVQPTPGTLSRHVNGTVGVPEVSRRVH